MKIAICIENTKIQLQFLWKKYRVSPSFILHQGLSIGIVTFGRLSKIGSQPVYNRFNRFNIDPEPDQNWFKIGLKLVQNPFNIGSNRFQNRFTLGRKSI